MASLGCLIHRCSFRQCCCVFTRMTLCRRYEAYGAVTVLVVVPLNEPSHPDTSFLDALERTAGVDRGIFQRAEQRLRVRVVIAHRTTRECRQNPQPLQSGQHGCAFHWAAVVSMQDDLTRLDVVPEASLFDQSRCMTG